MPRYLKRLAFAGLFYYTESPVKSLTWAGRLIHYHWQLNFLDANFDEVYFMDLSNLDVVAFAEQGVTVELKHPATGELLVNDKDEPMVIVVAGSDSKLFKSVIGARIKQNALKKGKKDEIDLEEMEKRGAETLAKCTLSWSGIQEGEKALPFSVASAQALYIKYPWIKEQVDAACGDRSALFKA